MKAKRWKSAAFLMGMAVSLLLAYAPIQAGESQPTLNKKELKRLIASAKTPEDHQKLAAYYRQQAQNLTAKQKEHEEMAVEYEKSPIGYPTKYPPPARHCRNWATYYAQSAKEAQALAALHEEKAKEAAK